MKRGSLCIVATIILAAPALANPYMHQIITTSWPGLSGLYMIPTARTLKAGQVAMGFNEAKHAENVEDGRYVDRQIRGVVTWGVSDCWEVYGSYYNDLFTVPPGVEPQLSNQSFATFGFKYRIMQEDSHYWFPTVAVGVRDIGNSENEVGPLEGVHNGRKLFILASKKLLKSEELGRFMDVHAGVTLDSQTTAAMLGFELTLTPSVSLIAEGMWDSPFINYREYGRNDVAGKYIFDVGIRMYPELVPGLVLDTGFVGDGEFEFSFGVSYVMGL
ncbi:YjbH domain-containing protein [bacterium]|nr:YjbH domain-containing protein [bacterium]